MTAHPIGRPRTSGAAWMLGCLLLACAPPASAGDDQAAARGRRLFESGIGGDGRSVEAVFAGSATPVPGTLLSCAGCHGRDGKGRTARGIDPPDINWQTLTKPYSLRVGAGRTRPPYTDALVVRAVTLGRDSGGRLLATAMPRFRLAPGEAADLVAYLRELGSQSDPGVGAEMLSIGILIPRQERQPAIHDVVRAALGTYLEQLNRNGGIFGRRVEFTFIEDVTGLDGAEPAARARTIEQTALAVVGSAVGAEHDIAVLAKQSEVPLVALRPEKDSVPGRQVFYLSAGVVGELRALAAQAARQLATDRARLAILYRDDDHGRGLKATLRPLVERDGWQTIDEVPLPVGGAPKDLPEEALRRIESDDAVLIATPDPGIGTVLSSLGKSGRNTLVLLPGSATAPRWLPMDLSPQAQILLGFELAGLPAGTRSSGTFPPEYDLPELTLPAQHTLAAAKLLVEGLRRAGRDVTRAKLIDAIETIQRFETGYLPPLSYGLRQHFGFTGAQIVPFDPRRRQLMEPLGRIEFK